MEGSEWSRKRGNKENREVEGTKTGRRRRGIRDILRIGSEKKKKLRVWRADVFRRTCKETGINNLNSGIIEGMKRSRE